MKFAYVLLIFLILLCFCQVDTTSVTDPYLSKITISPSDGAVFFSGDTIHFKIAFPVGYSEDVTTIAWNDDKEGKIGDGDSCSTLLSMGYHNIHATLEIAGKTHNIKCGKIRVIHQDSINIYLANEDSYCINGVVYDSPSEYSLSKMTVFNNNLYFIDNDFRECGYWENGVKKILEEGVSNFSVKDIFVDSSGIYVAGGVRDSAGIITGCVWRNGKIYFTNTTQCTNVFKTGNDLYVTTVEDKLNCLWKNGVKIFSTDERVMRPDINYLSVQNGNFFLAGTIPFIDDDMVILCASFWKNGEEHIITLDSSSALPYSGLRLFTNFVYENDIYTLGNNFNAFVPEYLLCINGQVIERHTDRGYGCVYVHHGHLFLTGVYIENGETFCCYWRNGKRHDLPEGYKPTMVCITDR